MRAAVIGPASLLGPERGASLRKGHARNTVLLCWGTRGVDLVAECEARARRLMTKVFCFDWQRHGRRAGHWRDCRLIESADLVAFFWDRRHRGILELLKFAQRTSKQIELLTLQGILMTCQGDGVELLGHPPPRPEGHEN